MKTIAYFAPVYRGHVVGTKHFIEYLANKEYQILYFAPQKYMELISKMNVTYIPYPGFLSLDFLIHAKLPTEGNVNSRLKFLLGKTINATEDLTLWSTDLLNAISVDLIIYDNMALWGYVAAHKLGLKNICALAIMATNTDVMKSTGDGKVYLTLSPESAEPLKLIRDKNITNIQTFTDVMTCGYNENKILYISVFSETLRFFSNKSVYVFSYKM